MIKMNRNDDRRQVNIYLYEDQIQQMEQEAKSNHISRNKLLNVLIARFYPHNNKEVQQNGTGQPREELEQPEISSDGNDGEYTYNGYNGNGVSEYMY